MSRRKTTNQSSSILEKEGYNWTPSEAPTSFVPMKTDPNAKLIVTKPSLSIAYSNNCERSKEIFQDSHTYVTGSEYLERKEKRVKKKTNHGKH